MIDIDTTLAPFVDIDGIQKPGGSMPLEDYADHELKTRDAQLSALRAIARLDHPFAKFAKAALSAVSEQRWAKARTIWSNRITPV